VGHSPWGVEYVPATGEVYVTNQGSSNLSVIDGTQVVNSTTLSSALSGGGGMAYDPLNGDEYLADYIGSTVEVFGASNLTLRTIISVSPNAGPYDALYDPADGYVYVTLGNLDPGTVIVINGTSVTASLTTGGYPTYLAYDPVDGDVYCVNTASVANSGSNISVINGTKVVATVTPTGGHLAWPGGIAYDPLNHYLYVPNRDLGNVMKSTVTVLDPSATNPTRFLTNISGFNEAWAPVFDSANGFVYVSEYADPTFGQGPTHLTVLNGTSFVENLSMEGGRWATFDPQDGYVYVANTSGSSVTVISTVLGGGGIAFHGADVNLTASFNLTLRGIGNGSDAGHGSVVPSTGLGCSSSAKYGVQNGYGYVAWQCSPSRAGNYSLWLNVSDGLKNTYWSRVNLTVFDPPTISVPRANRTSLDVGQTVSFNTSVTKPGSGSDLFKWHASASLGCRPSNSTDLNCTPSAPGIGLSVNVTVTDSNGVSATSKDAFVAVDPRVVATVPTATVQDRSSATGADVNESVLFEESPRGGTGLFHYAWMGVPDGACTGNGTANLSCRFPAPGPHAVAVEVADTNGEAVVSATLQFQVSSVPIAQPPRANRTSLDEGGSVLFGANVSGGSGGGTYVWSNVPSVLGCIDSAGPQMICIPTGTGLGYTVTYTYTDSNGVSAQPETSPPVAVFPAPRAGLPIPSSETVDVGQSISFTANVSGGSGGGSYRWTAPATLGCGPSRNVTIYCQPSAPGPAVGVSYSFTDSDRFSNTSGSVTVLVDPDPAVQGPTIRPSTVQADQPVTITVTVTGGSGGLAYQWLGHPTPCASTNGTVACRPTEVGTFSISANVTDSNKVTARSSVQTLTVTPIPPPSNRSKNGTGSTNGTSGAFGGGGWSVLVYGGIVAAIALVVVAIGLRARRRPGPPEGPATAPQPPPPR
jgi:DNA-binding beta-propeller fold protein YncE